MIKESWPMFGPEKVVEVSNIGVLAPMSKVEYLYSFSDSKVYCRNDGYVAYKPFVVNPSSDVSPEPILARSVDVQGNQRAIFTEPVQEHSRGFHRYGRTKGEGATVDIVPSFTKCRELPPTFRTVGCSGQGLPTSTIISAATPYRRVYPPTLVEIRRVEASAAGVIVGAS